MDRETRNQVQTAMVRRYIMLAAVGALVLLGIITLLTAMRSVDTGRVGVVTQYGEVTGRELDEGLSFVAPWGLNNVTEYDIKTQKVEAQSAAATKDLQDVNSTIVLTYNLNRGKVSEVHQQVGADFQSIEIDPQVQEAFKAVSAQFTASELITKRAEVKANVFDDIKTRLEKDGRYTVTDLAITDFGFSAEFNTAIEAVQIANQNVAQARQELETVKVNAQKSIEEAQAQAEAQRLKQATLTPQLLQQEAIKKWNGVLPQYSGSDGGLFFNIPAPKTE